MSDAIHEEPPDENEAFAGLDESLDEVDIVSPGRGPEGERDLGADVVADQSALHEIGADLDDPDRISLLDGGMDDPDGTGPPLDESEGAEEATDDPADPELEIVDTDPADLEQVPDDAAGPDSARW